MIKVKSVKNLTASSRKAHRAMPALESNVGGGLLIAFREGTDHVESGDGCLKLLSSYDGETWSEETLVPENPRYDVRVDHGMTQIDDGIYLPYQQYTMRRSSPECRTVILISKGGEEWGEIRVKQSRYFYPYGKMLVQNGQIRIPGYYSFGYNRPSSSTVIRSLDGSAWSLTCNPNLRFNEADICKVGDKFLAVIREEEEKFSFTSASKDGRKWSKPRRLPFTIQSPSLLKVEDRLLLAGRELERRRGKFGFMITRTLGTSMRESLDQGETWSKPLMIDKVYSWDCGYPSLLGHDGKILCAFYSEFAHGNSDILLAELEVD